MDKVAKPEASIVHLLSVGPFGEAVGSYLKTIRDDIAQTSVIDNTVPLPATWPDARLHVLVAWRPVPDLCELLNQLSHEWQRPFFPVIQDLTAIRFGPIVVPGRGACWKCWVTRWHQHSGWTKERASLLSYYASHSSVGPAGYLEPFALMTAVRIAQTVTAVDSATATPGSLWQIDMLTRQVTGSIVVGVHDCRWCGLGRPKATRSFAEMQKELKYLRSAESGKLT
jgi:bacteriocin biosynthesis cyclodehydratase domain-containing protein